MGNPSKYGQHQTQREICRVVVEHIRRIGDRNAVSRGKVQVDVVVTHAEIGHQPQIRQRCHQLRSDRGKGIGGQRWNTRTVLLKKALGILRLPEFMDSQLCFQLGKHGGEVSTY